MVLFQAQAQRHYVTKSDFYYRGYGCHRERNEYSFNDSITTEYTDINNNNNNNNANNGNTSSSYSFNYYNTTPRSCSLNNIIPNVSTPKSNKNIINNNSVSSISPINKNIDEKLVEIDHNNNSLNQPNQRISNINYSNSSLSNTTTNQGGGGYQFTNISPNYYYNHHPPHPHHHNHQHHHLHNHPSSISSSIYQNNHNNTNNHPFQEDVKARPHYVNLDLLPANFKINLNNRKDRKKFINMGYNHSRNDERILFSFADWE